MVLRFVDGEAVDVDLLDYRVVGLNLLAAIVVYWNTARLGEAVRQRERAGKSVAPELPAHISPLGWAHILSVRRRIALAESVEPGSSGRGVASAGPSVVT